MRFLGLGLAAAVPDANTIRTFREALEARRCCRRLVPALRRAFAGRLASIALWRAAEETVGLRGNSNCAEHLHFTSGAPEGGPGNSPALVFIRSISDRTESRGSSCPGG